MHLSITRPPSEWQAQDLDLDRYLDRVGVSGPLPPTTATLTRLYTAHQQTIPFENVTALRHRAVPLDIDALQAKMVRRRRGGYCHEHVLLLAAALERVGIPVARLVSRVRPQAPRALPRTHLLLIADVDGRRWMCDIGFGVGVLAPMELRPHTVRQGDWTFGLTHDGAQWTLSQRTADGRGEELHAFEERWLTPADVEMANHYVATAPRSPFAHRLIAMRSGPTRRQSLTDLLLTVEGADGTRDQRRLTVDEALQALEEVFDIGLTGDEAAAVTDHLTARA